MKYKIYTTTKGKKEDTLLYKSLNIKYYDIPVHYEEKNTKSLQSCYNSFLEDARNNNVDICVFVHHDKKEMSLMDLLNNISIPRLVLYQVVFWLLMGCLWALIFKIYQLM